MPATLLADSPAARLSLVFAPSMVLCLDELAGLPEPAADHPPGEPRPKRYRVDGDPLPDYMDRNGPPIARFDEPTERQANDPTPCQIRFGCLAIQSGWSEEERRIRAGMATTVDEYTGWLPPGASVHGSAGLAVSQ